jgi:hypothetical protein
MTNEELSQQILTRFLPLAFTCECKGTHPSCKDTMETPYAFAQSETTWRIALWIKDLKDTE